MNKPNEQSYTEPVLRHLTTIKLIIHISTEQSYSCMSIINYNFETPETIKCYWIGAM